MTSATYLWWCLFDGKISDTTLFSSIRPFALGVLYKYVTKMANAGPIIIFPRVRERFNRYSYWFQCLQHFSCSSHFYLFFYALYQPVDFHCQFSDSGFSRVGTKENIAFFASSTAFSGNLVLFQGIRLAGI